MIDRKRLCAAANSSVRHGTCFRRHLRPPPPSPAHGPRHARPWLSLGSLAPPPKSRDSMSEMLQIEPRRILAIPVWIRVHRHRTKDIRAQAQTQFRLRLCIGASGYSRRDYACLHGNRSFVFAWSRSLMGRMHSTNRTTPMRCMPLRERLKSKFKPSERA